MRVEGLIAILAAGDPSPERDEKIDLLERFSLGSPIETPAPVEDFADAMQLEVRGMAEDGVLVLE